MVSAITREMTPVIQSREATEVKTQSHIKEPKEEESEGVDSGERITCRQRGLGKRGLNTS